MKCAAGLLVDFGPSIAVSNGSSAVIGLPSARHNDSWAAEETDADEQQEEAKEDQEEFFELLPLGVEDVRAA